MRLDIIRAARWAFPAACAALAAINGVRLFRHAMWRDEIHAFALAAASATPADLFAALRYEAHPGLWYALLWLLTRWTTDPVWMQALQLVIALGTWALILRCAPFSALEKLLLLLGYFLFWEYFILARGYGLGALLGLLAVALRDRLPAGSPWPWLVLGALANTSVFGAIWSLGLAPGLWASRAARGTSWLAGGALYLLLLVAAVVTMMPAPDMRYAPPQAPQQTGMLADAAAYPRGAFLPRQLTLLAAPILGRSAAPDEAADGSARGFGLPADAAAAIWLLLPLAFAALILRQRRFVLEFLITYAGTIAFAASFAVPGYARHHGILFLALVGAAWGARSRSVLPARASGVWIALVAVSAIAGLSSLANDLRPYSRARDVAVWIRAQGMADRFLIGWRDMPASTVAGYLGRSIYHLECECVRPYVIWNTARRDVGDDADLATRLDRALVRGGVDEAFVIASHPRVLPVGVRFGGLAVVPLASFRGAVLAEEDFTVYRVRRAGASGAARDPEESLRGQR